MADARGLSTGPGWWQRHADALLNAVESAQAYVPALSADGEDPVFEGTEAATITRVALIPQTAYVPGNTYLVNKGTSGTLNGTIASRTLHATLTALVPVTLTLGTTRNTLNISDGEVLTFKRLTASGDTAVASARVTIEYELTNTVKN